MELRNIYNDPSAVLTLNRSAAGDILRVERFAPEREAALVLRDESGETRTLRLLRKNERRAEVRLSRKIAEKYTAVELIDIETDEACFAAALPPFGGAENTEKTENTEKSQNTDKPEKASAIPDGEPTVEVPTIQAEPSAVAANNCLSAVEEVPITDAAITEEVPLAADPFSDDISTRSELPKAHAVINEVGGRRIFPFTRFHALDAELTNHVLYSLADSVAACAELSVSFGGSRIELGSPYSPTASETESALPRQIIGKASFDGRNYVVFGILSAPTKPLSASNFFRYIPCGEHGYWLSYVDMESGRALKQSGAE